MNPNRYRLANGFTLIELLVTLAILALLATMVVPMAQVTVQRQKEHELKQALHEIRASIDAYKLAADQGHVQLMPGASGYPPSLNELVVGVADLKSPAHTTMYFLRRIPRDPFNRKRTYANEKTWGLRSYASAADSPQEGKDVYDVYSLESGTGLNGIPYSKW